MTYRMRYKQIDAEYNMKEIDVGNEGRFEDSIGIFPEFIDGYGVLILLRLEDIANSI